MGKAFLSQMFIRCIKVILETAICMTANSGQEYCPGYVDDHQQWNNGFYCLRWSEDPLQNYCCGNDRNRYCCPPPKEPKFIKPATERDNMNIPLITGVTVGAGILLVAITVASCFMCQCCAAYKKRKQPVSEPSAVIQEPRTDRLQPCPANRNSQQTILPPIQGSLTPPYPDDAPPPYIESLSDWKVFTNSLCTDLYAVESSPGRPLISDHRLPRFQYSTNAQPALPLLLARPTMHHHLHIQNRHAL